MKSRLSFNSRLPWKQLVSTHLDREVKLRAVCVLSYLELIDVSRESGLLRVSK
jgi:hypothetical protein